MPNRIWEVCWSGIDDGARERSYAQNSPHGDRRVGRGIIGNQAARGGLSR